MIKQVVFLLPQDGVHYDVCGLLDDLTSRPLHRSILTYVSHLTCLAAQVHWTLDAIPTHTDRSKKQLINYVNCQKYLPKPLILIFNLIMMQDS